MLTIFKKRRQGKTHDLIKHVAVNGGTLVCSCMRAVREVEKQAQKMNCKINVVPFSDILNASWFAMSGGVLENYGNVYIDDVESCLQVVGVPLKGLSLNNYDESKTPEPDDKKIMEFRVYEDGTILSEFSGILNKTEKPGVKFETYNLPMELVDYLLDCHR